MHCSFVVGGIRSEGTLKQKDTLLIPDVNWVQIETSLSAIGITRCSAWVHLANMHKLIRELSTMQLEGLNNELVYFGI
jgi:hypothetical protein